MWTRSQYKGDRHHLVLAFDIGTTYSGISYSVLDPGQVPEIKGVTRFPAHEFISGASKIPTIIYYDQAGEVRAVGAEATREGIFGAAEDGQWVKAEWFKLHLRSKIGGERHIAEYLPPLPLNKTIVEVIADFLHYLLECASGYIRDTHANGPVLWDSVKRDIDFVLMHPNGWHGEEQAQMLKAAVLAGLIPDTVVGHGRVFFVSEGESYLCSAIQNGATIKSGEGVVIVDAGDKTIDVSSYRIGENIGINSYEEVAPPQQHHHGSVFVSIHARLFLEVFLEGSAFIDDLDHIMHCFDKTTKLRFRNAEEFQYIKFGSTRDNDSQYNIRFGQLKLAGSDVAQFFEPSVECINSAVLSQRDDSYIKISHVVLFGELAANEWVFNRVFTQLEKLGLKVIRPERLINRPNGAILAYLDRLVHMNSIRDLPLRPATTTSTLTRCQYKGDRRRLVLAFDIGATYSGISYSVLVPGEVPQIKGVTRFPAHELISGASKIPTIIYYDQAGKVRAVGAEATREGIFEAAEDGQWVKSEWFKLHLRSKIGGERNIAECLPPLPLNKTIVEVIADFLRYMLECASSYIRDTHANGPALWDSVKADIDFVLSHPNGWEGKEQVQMRKAAVLAGLIPDTVAAHARVSFVAEGEASLRFAIQNGVLSAAIEKGEEIVIVDAGGGTIDVSSYTRGPNTAINSYEEIAPPQCHFHGSIFVSIHARAFLKAFLEGSHFIDDLDHIVRCFDQTTKPRFRNAEEPQYIKFGSTRDNDPRYNVRFGQLKLAGSDVALFFEPSVKCIVSAVLSQRNKSHSKISHVVLVGGFAASDWLFNRVLTPFQKLGLNVLRPENHINKAVSDGAISFYLDHFVRDDA